MTIGINPNLTAFAPGTDGHVVVLSRTSQRRQTADLWTKYAYYYRYRSVFQERFDLDLVKQFLLPEPRVMAAKSGSVVSALRPTDAPSFDLHGPLRRRRGRHRLHAAARPRDAALGLLFDPIGNSSRSPPATRRRRSSMCPPARPSRSIASRSGYYEQFVPVLEALPGDVRQSGHPEAPLQMGEDVCQLDMVACASPHWTPDFLGGTAQSRADHHRQLRLQERLGDEAARADPSGRPVPRRRVDVQHVPGAVRRAVAARSAALRRPADQAFTLLRETTDPAHPCTLRVRHECRRGPVQPLNTARRHAALLVLIELHAADPAQPDAWKQLQQDDPACAAALNDPPRVIYQPPVQQYDYAAFLIAQDAAERTDGPRRVASRRARACSRPASTTRTR